MNIRFIALSAAAAAVAGSVALAGVASAQSRDQIRVVGSSTVYPFTTAVAEQFGKSGAGKTPVVESTGTGGGFKIFCQGLGTDQADVTGASRAIKQSEMETCAKNGVNDITEALIGYDGLSIAIARGGADMDLNERQIFMALAAEVPVNGAWVANPYKSWSEIDPALPNVPIHTSCSRSTITLCTSVLRRPSCR